MRPATRDGTAAARRTYLRTREAHWDTFAQRSDSWSGWEAYYHRRLTPLLTAFAHRVPVKLWPFRMLALTNLIVARRICAHD